MELRLSNRQKKEGIAPGDYAFRMVVIVGDLNTLRDSMRTLHRLSAELSPGSEK